MRPAVKLSAVFFYLAFSLALLAASPPLVTSFFARVAAQTPPAATAKPPETIQLATEAKLGAVTFNHAAHNSSNRNIAGTAPIQCVECHHVAQPAAALANKLPLKTTYPPDRTTTLTADLYAKDPQAAGVARCRDCHARAGETSKLLPAIPTIKNESSTADVTLTNQQAFHRNCTGCHNEIAKNKPDSKAPTSTKCAGCHKKSA